MKPAQKSNSIKTLKRLIKYMSNFRTHFIFVIIFIFISTFSNLFGTFLLRYAINSAVDGNKGELIKYIIIMAAVYSCGVISTYIYNRLMLVINTKVLAKLRDDMFTHMQKLPVKYFDSRTNGEIMSSYTNDTDALREMISQGVPQLINSVLMTVGSIIMMLILSPALTLITIVMLALMLFIVAKIGGKSGKYFGKMQESLGKANGYIEEYVEGQKVVKVFSHEKKANEGFAKINDELCENATKAHTYASVLMPIMGNISYLFFALIAMIGGIMAVNGIVGDVGTIISFLQYTRQLTMPVSQIANLFNAILMALAGANRIFNLLDEKQEVDNGYVTLVNAKYDNEGNLIPCEEKTGLYLWKHPHRDGTTTYTKSAGNVEFDKVTFGYEEDKAVLKDISINASYGQKIALVGTTGAGKTTITNLINGFYNVPDGKIRIDGININKIKKDDLRRSLAMVLQDTHLFTNTVMENIRYGKLDATDDEVFEAAKLANAHSFIMHLPDRYNTMLTADGANLSQGQRQLLAIARAAIANPTVLIFDEATSSIDTRTESLIEQGMDTIMQGKTVFIIAHRLSTVRNCDAILVLEKGEIIEKGTHNELLDKKGQYYKFYTGVHELN